jgi:ABC-type phosphate transport system substrate-binding protein
MNKQAFRLIGIVVSLTFVAVIMASCASGSKLGGPTPIGVAGAGTQTIYTGAAGTTQGTGTTTVQACGDGVIDVFAGEQCDGTNLSNSTCESLGYAGGGTLQCLGCRYDFSMCIAVAPDASEGDYGDL